MTTAPAYTGIGARETPPDVLALAAAIGRYLSARGVTLRSGGSPGADAAFEAGCGSGPKEIYLPWPGFNGRAAPYAMTDAFFARVTAHEAWRVIRDALAHESPPLDLAALPPDSLLLYARDVPQILGPMLDAPSTRIICWTPPSGPPEGTRIALYVARHWSVPVENLNDPATFQRWQDLIATG